MRFKTFKIDAHVTEHGNSVLQLSDLTVSPTDLMWGRVKECCKRNTAFKAEDAVGLGGKKSYYEQDMWMTFKILSSGTMMGCCGM
jgi:hypothetical protein